MLEASDRAGGVIATDHVDGCVVERGPESLRPGSAPAWSVIQSAGLAGQVVQADRASKRRYLLLESGLEAVPSSIAEALRSPVMGRRAVLRLLAEPSIPRGMNPAASVHEVLSRRIGRRLADRVADPVVAGIFGGDAHALEFASAFARAQALEDAHGSWVVGGLRGREEPDPTAPTLPFTFRGGMAKLVNALATPLGSNLRLSTPVQALTPAGRGWQLSTPAGEVRADHVVLTAPPHAAAALLGRDLDRWPHAPVAAVHLAWPTAQLPAPLDGFGWLAHSRARRDVLGAIWVTAVFPSHARPGVSIIRVMLGGTRAPELVGVADDALVDHCCSVL
ncbi:MAG: oxygen-dependent protoporphyrinogen oxidase, partial [Myxococcota bacterium]